MTWVTHHVLPGARKGRVDALHALLFYGLCPVGKSLAVSATRECVEKLFVSEGYSLVELLTAMSTADSCCLPWRVCHEANTADSVLCAFCR